jgi:hypothetical protein
MALAPGCSSSPTASNPTDGGPAIVDAAYGGPPYDGPIGEPAYGGGPVEVFDAAYGGPPVGLDGAPPTDAGDGGDAEPVETFDAAYGGPPTED